MDPHPLDTFPPKKNPIYQELFPLYVSTGFPYKTLRFSRGDQHHLLSSGRCGFGGLEMLFEASIQNHQPQVCLYHGGRQPTPPAGPPFPGNKGFLCWPFLRETNGLLMLLVLSPKNLFRMVSSRTPNSKVGLVTSSVLGSSWVTAWITWNIFSCKIIA